MQKLETHFEKNRFNFEQVKRDGNLAIFRKTKTGFDFEVFEVVQITERDACEIFGNQVEASEVYPSAEQWGTRGFTATTLIEAEAKFEQLTQTK